MLHLSLDPVFGFDQHEIILPDPEQGFKVAGFFQDLILKRCSGKSQDHPGIGAVLFFGLCFKGLVPLIDLDSVDIGIGKITSHKRS